ncbi:exonuclease DPD1, chloroplastic/mitochondrial [Ananas comosus]|uniref:Exonuclease DPD1, chloroplastic/mitochondrial n=2 Tax=Ananas comosus TaxID=4615 RepID=A0A199VN87_ANACO|nr:exonuclease DPD1, chloroplastic/mitochondrial [Ananas comosus]XP_020107798.1 exonuclease DPD1, chloroplastic/mitochondrial [Ananas comosus]XP_020107799.1 exonuclease DPD1, chloroplastic/mitochondrial [Ananas comosus]OAY78652.1 Exonuclease DPD1, chloroplastic/mitochondrial [Ananas comosus]
MSLAAICSGNFNQLRNSLGNCSNINLLKFHSGLVPGKVLLETRRCTLRPLSTRVEARSQRSEDSKPSIINLSLRSGTVGSSPDRNLNQSELHEFKSIQCYNLQEKIVDKKIDRPATILVFDIETTGFSRQNERIIEFALRDLMGGKNSTFQTLVNPEKDVPNAFVHGISTYMVNRPDVPRFKELVPILLHYVRSRQMAGKPVLWVAHNGRRFDVPFFIKEFQRCSEEIPSDWLFVDTLPLARQLVNPDGSKLSSSSLKALREHYEIPLVGPAHRAMQDVTTLCYVLQRITFDLKLTVPELIDKAFRASDLN